ncbi:serine/threonine protein kinase, partial [Candidatus Woesearchaeota archaeon CG10_big_fil_rev_8_21_14_0_10_47_5]
KDPLAQERLMRDIKNICSFFKKLGVDAGEDDVLRRIRQQ